MTTQVRKTTADELLSVPRDGYRYELVEGELRRVPSAGSEHGLLALAFASELRNYVKAKGLGKAFAAETGFKLASNPDTVRAPDAAFVTRERLAAVGAVSGYWPGAPDLALEVVSPNDLYTEVGEKVAAWLGAGSKMVVVVDPRSRQVLVHTPDGVEVYGVGDTLGGGEVVPGWALPVRELFED